MSQPYPILEFDPSRGAVIEPSVFTSLAGGERPGEIGRRCVLCFLAEVMASLLDRGEARVVGQVATGMGSQPLLELQRDGRAVAVFHPGVGAPMAAANLEKLIALGLGRFVACGGAGVLDAAIAPGTLIVATSAVRDEGTSYHYAAPSREVPAPAEGVAALEAALRAGRHAYRLGKTWTTDALFRETPARVRRRAAEGCITVEMEAAALFAVAQFRSVPLGVLLYAGDDVSGEQWDARRWDARRQVRRGVFDLAVEACLRL